jgi:hypothetical protein
VIDVDEKGFWDGFVETGDPVFYLLARRLEEQERRERAQKPKRSGAADGDLPRPWD